MIDAWRKTYRDGTHPALLCLCVLLHPANPVTADELPLDPVTVTATRSEVPSSRFAGNIARIDESTIRRVAPKHPSELFYRAPGTWIPRGSGQEHLTAIRSPVLTGAGACGGFLFMENGVPVRPAGFCNVNALFEINYEQAGAVEVVRGPGSALYGSNALHGSINVLGPTLAEPENSVSLEAGSWDYYRLAIDQGRWHDDGGFRLRGHAAHDGGYRDNSNYEQAKVNLDWSGSRDAGDVGFGLAATRLRQDTAGFIFGKDAYQDGTERRSNPQSGAFRDADAARFTGFFKTPIDGATALELRPYARYSWMEFEQHFLPGQPVEENRQVSAGLQTSVRSDADDGRVWIVGLDAEYMDAYLEEIQTEAIEDGSDFLRETRPAGRHYDYDVDSWQTAAYVHHERPLTQQFRGQAGLRYEYLRYDYDNRMLAGNTREDGTECGFGGCLFNRPADRDDSFDRLAPKLGLLYSISPHAEAYATAVRGFRFPQATELYRLQRQQDVADLDPEVLDSIEFGWRARGAAFFGTLAAFYMEKDNVIFRDAEGINVSDGETRHVGIEVALDWQVSARWSLAWDATWARHTYRFDRAVGGGETIESGDDVDTAPRRISNARLRWDYAVDGSVELEWLSLGSYYLDAANSARYDGHDLIALRVEKRWSGALASALRITNVLNEDYAERADFAFGNYRYQPGRERAVFVEFRYGGS